MIIDAWLSKRMNSKVKVESGIYGTDETDKYEGEIGGVACSSDMIFTPLSMSPH